MTDPAGPIQRAIDDATGRDRPRLPYECAGCGARYAGEKARDGCCLANAFARPDA